ncbi:MFS transporter [Streptacidiphilus neutrinimicus]|uniref:MFS transporter n=1 Tax=Streptacidiphilus neutrinimicus TaxID=105420 RepID=UPI000A06B8B8|nr:MFS transporter [Streptacidiphilus neutrinimicus]
MRFTTTAGTSPAVSRRYAWVVFALSFALLLSDYMSRQVLNAVFPLLKAQWLLSDAKLGSLSGVVALAVGLLTFPMSFLADRWGRVTSLLFAAVLWSLATVGCAVSAGYGQLFVGRIFVGVGEAAYGSVGIAVVLSVFPVALRATLSGAFIAGGAFGSVLGVALGGALAQQFGWRWAFGTMGLLGLVLAAVYALVVTEKRLDPQRGATAASEPLASAPLPSLLPQLFSSVSVISAYVGSGLQFLVPGALIAWLPSYFNRSYHLSTAEAGATAGVFTLLIGVGMIAGGILSDRISQTVPLRKWTVAIGSSLASLVLLTGAFSLPDGTVQLVLLAAGCLACAGTAGPAAAMVANLTPALVSATAFATLTLANSLLGLAPGPSLTGVLADHTGLRGALQLVPLVSVVTVAVFLLGRRRYTRDLLRLTTRSAPADAVRLTETPEPPEAPDAPDAPDAPKAAQPAHPAETELPA